MFVWIELKHKPLGTVTYVGQHNLGDCLGTRTWGGSDAISPLLSLDHCLSPDSLAHDNGMLYHVIDRLIGDFCFMRYVQSKDFLAKLTSLIIGARFIGLQSVSRCDFASQTTNLGYEQYVGSNRPSSRNFRNRQEFDKPIRPPIHA